MASVHTATMFVRIPMRTRNPLNGATGNSRVAGILKARLRASQRACVHAHVLHEMVANRQPPAWWLPVDVTVTRVAPSAGLDPHDGLGAALKGVIDGVADALGLENDRDPVVAWKLEQRRGRKGEWAVEIDVRRRN